MFVVCQMLPFCHNRLWTGGKASFAAAAVRPALAAGKLRSFTGNPICCPSADLAAPSQELPPDLGSSALQAVRTRMARARSKLSRARVSKQLVLTTSRMLAGASACGHVAKREETCNPHVAAADATAIGCRTSSHRALPSAFVVTGPRSSSALGIRKGGVHFGADLACRRATNLRIIPRRDPSRCRFPNSRAGDRPRRHA